MVLRAARSCWS